MALGITQWKFYENRIIIDTFMDQKPWKVTCWKSPISPQLNKLETILWYLYDRMGSFYLLIRIKYQNFKQITNTTHLNKLFVSKAINTIFAQITSFPVTLKMLNWFDLVKIDILHQMVSLLWKSNNNWLFYRQNSVKSDSCKIAHFSATAHITN